MIKENEIWVLRSEVVSLQLSIKELSPVDESVPTASILQGFLFNGFTLIQARALFKTVALPEEGRSPVKCGEWALDLLPIHSQDIPYYTPRNSLIFLVRLSLFLQGVRGRLAFLDRCPPSISWNLLISYNRN